MDLQDHESENGLVGDQNGIERVMRRVTRSANPPYVL